VELNQYAEKGIPELLMMADKCDRRWFKNTELRCKTRRAGERYGCAKAPVVKDTVILVEVSRLPHETRKPKQLWMWWVGEGEPDLDLIWRNYYRRFSL